MQERSSVTDLLFITKNAGLQHAGTPSPDGVTGRIIDLLRRAATHSLTLRSKSVGLEELQQVGAKLPTIINQRA